MRLYLPVDEVEQDDLEYHELLDKIDSGAEGNFEDYDFNNLFGNRLRIIIPLGGKETSHLNDNIVQKMLSREGYKADFSNGTAVGSVKTQRGDQDRTMKLGRLLQRLSKNDPEWRNVLHWWEMRQDPTKTMGDPTGVSVIISRSPIDIIRMSDHDEWGSCHAPPGKSGHISRYWPCAGQEARTGGAIAYVVRNADLQDVDDIQAADIFDDADRDVDGVSPLERLRLRRFRVFDHNGHDKLDILLPEESTYGTRHVGFFDTVLKWAKESQSKWIDFSKPPNWDKAKLYGGSYMDVGAATIWSKFFGVRVSGSKNTEDSSEEGQHHGAGAASIEASAQEQLNAHEYKRLQVGYDIGDDGEGAYVMYWGTATFEFPEEDFEQVPDESDFTDIWRYKSWYLERNPELKNKKPLGSYVHDELDWIDDEREHQVSVENGRVKIHLNVASSDRGYDLDGFEHFLDACDSIEKDYGENWAKLRRVLIDRGYLKEKNEHLKFQNFTVDEDMEWIQSGKIWIGDLNGVDSNMIDNDGGQLSFKGAAMSMQSNALTIFPQHDWMKEASLSFKVEGPRVNSWKTPDGTIRGNYQVYLSLTIFVEPHEMDEKLAVVKHLDQYWNQYQNRAAQWWKTVKPLLMNNKSGTYAAQSHMTPVKEKEPVQQTQLSLPFKDWLVFSELLPLQLS